MVRRRLHMKLGWSVLAIGATIAFTGTWVAIRSVQITPADFRFFNLEYRRFLLVMLTEIALFTFFSPRVCWPASGRRFIAR